MNTWNLLFEHLPSTDDLDSIFVSIPDHLLVHGGHEPHRSELHPPQPRIRYDKRKTVPHRLLQKPHHLLF